MNFNYKQPFVAVAAIIEKDGKVLMVQESDGPDKGRWSLPAGKWDVAENLITAIKREVLEETGFEFIPNYVSGIYTNIRTLPTGDKIQVLRPVFYGSIKGDFQGLSRDVIKTDWIDINKLEEIDYRSPDVPTMLDDFKKGIKYPLSIFTHKGE